MNEDALHTLDFVEEALRWHIYSEEDAHYNNIEFVSFFTFFSSSSLSFFSHPHFITWTVCLCFRFYSRVHVGESNAEKRWEITKFP